jgi:thiamine-phosphate pyrophosphorylase
VTRPAFDAGERLPPPLVCLVTDGQRPAGDLMDRVEAAVAGGVGMVQLREKQRPAGELLALACELRERLAGRALVLVNDRLDVALAARADGVHLPAAGLPARAARAVAPSLLIGRSVHSAEEAAQAAKDGVDYLVLGTIFATATHPGTAPGGLALVRAARARVDLPLLGIGGITPENAAAVIGAGADGVAVVSAILVAPDPRAAARALVTAVHDGWRARRGSAVKVGVS